MHTDWLHLHLHESCALRNRIWADLELLLEFAIETRQHRVGFLVFTDCHLDLLLLSGRQPEREFHPFLKKNSHREVKYYHITLLRTQLKGIKESMST